MKKLSIELMPNLGLVPPVIGYLGSVKEGSLSYRHYGLRHPGGIFNSQFGTLVFNLLDLTKYLNNIEISHDDRTWSNSELLRKYTFVLFAFTNYFHSAFDIILGCCEQKEPKPGKYIWKWLKENGYKAGGNYYARANTEAQYFLEIFNELKHSSNRFGGLYMTKNGTDKPSMHGYYLEAIDNVTGSLIPSEKFHPKHQGEYTANSFNLDIRKIYYCTYKLADILASELKNHFSEIYQKDLEFENSRKEDDKVCRGLLEEVQKLPQDFFPNEINRDLPLPRVVRRSDKEFLIFEIEKTSPARGQLRIMSSLTPPDGFARSWGIPFFRGVNR